MSKKYDLDTFLDRKNRNSRRLNSFSEPLIRHTKKSALRELSDYQERNNERHIGVTIQDEIICSSLQWEVECPLDWSAFNETDDPDVRFCNHCSEPVIQVYTQRELRTASDKGQCVRVLHVDLHHLMGSVRPDAFLNIGNPEDLIDAILEAHSAFINASSDNKLAPLIKTRRLIGRLQRYKAQLEIGVRSDVANSEFDDDYANDGMYCNREIDRSKVNQVERLVEKLDDFKELAAKAEKHLMLIATDRREDDFN